MKNKLIGLIASFLSLLVALTPAFAWNVNINALVNDATAEVSASGHGGDANVGYAVSTSGGILNGDGKIKVQGRGSDSRGGMRVKVGGSGASGDELYATHDLVLWGCCGVCPCPSEYLYEASSMVDVQNAESTEIKLVGGGDPEEGGIQIVSAEGNGDPTIAMYSHLETSEEPETHVMGAFGQNVWFTAFGKQRFDACDGIRGFLVTVMRY